MKKAWKANIAIEAAIILPLILFMFCGMITLLFYYHDKNIVTGAAYEIVTIGCREKEPGKEELGGQLQKRLNKKLILFHKIHVDIWIEEKEIVIRCQSFENGLNLLVQISMSRTSPETYIRNIRKIQRLENEMGEI